MLFPDCESDTCELQGKWTLERLRGTAPISVSCLPLLSPQCFANWVEVNSVLGSCFSLGMAGCMCPHTRRRQAFRGVQTLSDPHDYRVRLWATSSGPSRLSVSRTGFSGGGGVVLVVLVLHPVLRLGPWSGVPWVTLGVFRALGLECVSWAALPSWLEGDLSSVGLERSAGSWAFPAGHRAWPAVTGPQ